MIRFKNLEINDIFAATSGIFVKVDEDHGRSIISQVHEFGTTIKFAREHIVYIKYPCVKCQESNE